jgi:hypothetical protein
MGIESFYMKNKLKISISNCFMNIKHAETTFVRLILKAMLLGRRCPLVGLSKYSLHCRVLALHFAICTALAFHLSLPSDVKHSFPLRFVVFRKCPAEYAGLLGAEEVVVAFIISNLT